MRWDGDEDGSSVVWFYKSLIGVLLLFLRCSSFIIINLVCYLPPSDPRRYPLVGTSKVVYLEYVNMVVRRVSNWICRETKQQPCGIGSSCHLGNIMLIFCVRVQKHISNVN